jgi:hypothetical protein
MFTVIYLSHPGYEFIKLSIRNGLGLPVVRTICLTASKIDFSWRKNKYVSMHDLREIKKELNPGDIIFRRNEDQFTNIAISGFWTHSGI